MIKRATRNRINTNNITIPTKQNLILVYTNGHTVFATKA